MLVETNNSGESAGRRVDLLKWIGTAHGRRNVAVAVLVPSAQKVSVSPFVLRHRVLIAPAAIASISLLIFAIARGQGEVNQFPQEHAIQIPETQNAVSATNRTNVVAGQDAENKNQREASATVESDYHLADAEIDRLRGEVNELRAARENAERSAAAERVARETAENAVAAANEKLTHLSRAESAAPAVVTAKNSTAEKEDRPDAEQISKNAAVTQSGPAPIALNAAKLELATGQKLFAKGDIDEARRHLQTAANLGLPEAALALGNTFDPFSLAKAGVKDRGDVIAARRWYRQAYAMALKRKLRSTSG